MSTASIRITPRTRVSLHAIGLGLVFLLLGLPLKAVTFELTGASGSGTQTVQQTVGSDTLVITAVDDVFVVDSDTNVWGGGINNTSGTVMAVASGVGYESKVTLSVSGGKVFDLSSFTLVDIAGENKALTITTNKGSQTIPSNFSSLSWSVALASATFQGITYAELTTSHVSNQFAWGMDNFVLNNITLAPPTVTDARISLTSTGSGTGGAYKVGDTVTASWNNTGSGDNNAGITGVTMDFSQFGGGAAVTATNSSGTWTASFTLTAGVIDATNRNVSVSASSVNGTTTTADTTNSTVDTLAPTVTDARISISGASGTGGAFKIGDTVTATWNNTAAGDNNSDTLLSVTVDFSQFGGGAAVVASNSAGTWTATRTLTAGAINGTTNRNVSVTATDNAGNTTTRADTTNATVDNVAPTTTVSSLSFSSDTGSSSSDFITGTSSQTLSGTLSANLVSGESVEVSINNGSTWANATATVGTNTWSLGGLTLVGNDTLKVRVTDGAGNSGTTFSQAYSLDTAAPTTTISTIAFSADTGSSSTDFITRTATQTVSGTLSANLVSGEIVEVSIDNGSTWTTATSSVGSNTYSLSGITLIASNTLRVRVTDNAGNSGTALNQAFVLDTTAPTVTVSTIAFSADTGSSATDFITRTAAQTVSGTLSANLISGEIVEVSIDNGSTWSMATSSVGSNTYSLSGITLIASNTLRVRVTDTAGNSGTTQSQAYVLDTTAPTSTVSTVALSADTGVSSTDFITRTAAQTISGTLSANLVSGEIVEVSLDNGSTWTTATSSVGSNTFSRSGVTLTASDTLRVRVSDTAGNAGTALSQAYVLDTTAPTTTVATLSFSNDSGASPTDFITNLTAQSISGTLSANVVANERVEVSLDNGSTWVTATSTVGANTFSLAGQTLSSSNTLKVRLADAAGNTGTQASQAYVLDSVAPGAPTSFSAVGSGASASLTWSNPVTDFDSVTLRRSLSGFPNSIVAGAAVLSNSTGTSHIDTGLSDGVNYYSLFALDAAGNVSAAATTSVTIDGTAPNSPAIVAISNDTGTSATDHITTDPTLVFTGTADANTTVTLYRNASLIGTTTANGAGAWSFDYTGTTLAAGPHTFTATSTDTSGNISTPSTAFLVEIDSVTPNAPAITAITSDNGPLNSDGITNDRTLVFSGTGEIGASITLVRTGVGVIGTSTVNGAGAWSINYSGTSLPDGSYLFTAFATDAAGNAGSVSSDFPVTIDTVAPTITTQPSGGTFPPGGVLTLSVTATDGQALSYQWYRDDTQLGDNSERSGSTEATLSHSSIGQEAVAGNYRVVVTDRAGNSVTSEIVTVVVGKVDQSITFAVIEDKLTTSTPFEVFASVENKLPVTFSVVSGPASVNGRIVTLTGAGTVTLRATQAGSASFNPATADRSFVVSKALATLTLSALTATFDGSPKSASVTTVPAGLSVQLTYGGSTTLPTAPGSYPVVATITDATYQGSTSGTLVIANASQTISFPTPSNRTYGDAPFALVASASSGLPVSFTVASGPASIAGNILTLSGAGTVTVRALQEGSGTIQPALPVERSFVVGKKAATVTLSGLSTTYDGAARSVSVTTSPAGLATALTYNGNTTPPAQAGTYAVVGTIIDPNHAGSASVTLTIAKASQSLAFDAVSSVPVGASVALQATASSGLPVSFTVVSGEGTIAGNTLTLAGSGPVVVRASQAGNSNYEAATPVDRSVGANKLAQTITFAAPGDKTTRDTNFGLVATASSGLPVSFTVLSGPATVSGGTVSLTGLPGSVLIQASQSGNAVYDAAQPVIRSFLVAPVGPQVYFGSTTSGDRLAASFLPGSGTGTLLVYLSATREGFVVVLRVDPSGHFSGTAARNPSLQTGASVPDPTSSRTAMRDLAPVAATTPLTFQGTITQGMLSGSLVELGLNFSAPVESGPGVTPDLSGTYSAMSTTTASGSLHAIVGKQGRVFALAFTSEGTYSGESTLESGATFQINAGPSTLRGSIEAIETSIAVTVTHADGIKEVFAGLASTTAPTDRLINLSSRALVSSADSKTLITGFVIGGSSPKSLLLRAIGPGLAAFGVTQALVDPKLQIFNSAGQLLLENDNWSGTGVSEASARVGAFALTAQSKDAAVTATLPPGAYTMLVLDQGGAGVALAEIYELSETSDRQQRLINLSSRGHVAPGEGVIVGGFVVTGNTPKRLLIRAAGPGLSGFGVSGALVDPFLRLFDHTSTLIARNDNWETPLTAQNGQIAASAVDLAATAQEAGAFAFMPGSKDAAVLITLAPGLYSAQVSSSASASGVALIEVYEVIE